MKRLILIIFAFIFSTIPAFATTWYVRSDGGTRYSVNQTSGQCNGKYNAAYPGSGVDQNCAFNDVRYLWTDGSSTTNLNAGAPAWGWIGAGGDTYLINCPSDCRVGQSGPNSENSFGLAGDPSQAGAPPPLSGTAAQHTRILGVNYASCTSDSAKAHINGGYGVASVFGLQGASYVDVACLDITDHSNCGLSGQLNKCSTSYPLSDYALNGIYTNNTTTNVTITDVRIHGMAGSGMLGATGTGVSVLRVALVGNAASGWNMDDGSGKTGAGTLSVTSLSALWNGCAEEYPIVHALPYQDCTDDKSGGYGDGVATATVVPGASWNVTIANSIAAFNTQDGFDLLGFGGALPKSNVSSLSFSQSLSYSNMGQQLKIGIASTVQNNLFVGNCNALREPMPGTPAGYNTRLSDFCRGNDIAVTLKVDDASPSYFLFNTLYSANATGLAINCYGTCTTQSTMAYQDNIFLGFMNNSAYGYPSGGSGGYSTPLAVNVPELFSNSGSVFSYDATYNFNAGWTCPSSVNNETEPICEDPGLKDETWHLFGYGSMVPASNSVVASTGLAISGVTVDYTGATRSEPPSIGALQPGSNLPVEQITLVANPNPVGSNEPVTLTATVADTQNVAPTGVITFLNGTQSLGSAPINDSGTATLIVPSLPVAGTYALTGAYSGDPNYQPGGSGVVLVQVLSGTTTTLAASPNPSALGQTVTFTATVKGTAATSPAPTTGTVTFMSGSSVLATVTLGSSGKAVFATKSLPAGPSTITAEYSGSTNFGASSSAGLVAKVESQSSTTTLAATPNLVTVGQTLILTATVKGTGSTTPTGSVSIMNGSALLGTVALSTTGLATFSTSTLAVGTYSLTAVYSGDSTFGSSTSAAASVTVGAQSTTATLATSASSIAFGQALSLTATIKGSGITAPTGSVSFMNGSTLIGTSTLNAFGVAMLATTTLPSGVDSLTVKYAGNSSYLPSTSAVSTVTVQALSTTSTLVASASSINVGQPLTLTATVKGSTSTEPTGTVNFLNGSATVGTATLNSSGVATFTTSSLAAGSYKLAAQYVGNTIYATSTSAAVSVAVGTQATTIALVASPNSITAGQSVTLTATAVGNGVTPPTGTVNFFSNSSLLGSATLNSSGVATLATSSLSSGSYTLTAQYSGNAFFIASTSAGVGLTVAASTSSSTQGLAPATTSSSSSTTGGPVILYTDLVSGPNSGGEGNNGSYLTIFGTNFGATQGSSTVTINGKAVAQYILWSNTKIGVQVGAVTSGAIVVTVAGASSNSNKTFTVRSGHIYYIGAAADNSAPGTCAAMLAANSYTTPWGLTNYASTTEGNYSYTKMRTPYTYYNCLSLGDTLVFLNGASYPYFDGRGWHSSLTPDKSGGSATSFITIMARPGATAQLGGTGWIMDPIRDISTGYNVFSGLTLTGSGANGGADFSAGGGSTGDRVVGNTITCPDCYGQAAAAMGTNGLTLYGNTVENVATLDAGGSDKEYHAIYVWGNNVEIAWNTVTNTLAYNGIQINHDGVSGFYNQSYHDNDISEVNGSGINLSTIDPSSGYILVYNNVIHHVGMNVSSDGGGSDPHSCLAVKGYGTATAPGTVQVYNNTMYDCNGYLNVNTASGTSCAILTLAYQVNVTTNLVNNIISQPTYAGTSAQDVYFCGGGPTSSITGSHNIWYSATAPGSTGPATSYGVIENPLFVSTTNYQLQAGSPAIGKGIAFEGLATDINATPRPNPPSIGAYE